jgi:hypothetical protein
MPDYMTFYNLLRKEGRVSKDFASEIAEELVSLFRLEAPSGTDRAAAPVSVAEPVTYVNQADLDLLANYGTSGACVLYNRPVGNATIPLYAAQPTADNAPQAPSK